MIVDNLVINRHNKNHTETDVNYCYPVNRYPWARRVQPWRRLVWSACGAFDHFDHWRSQCRIHHQINSVRTAIQPTTDESTIEGPTPHSVEQADQTLAFQIMEDTSERGKRKFSDSCGFSYNVKRRRLDATHWQCTIRPTVRFFCVITYNNVSYISYGYLNFKLKLHKTVWVSK